MPPIVKMAALALIAMETIHFWGWDWTLADLINAAIAVATLLTFLAGFGAVVMAARANATALAAARDASDKAAAALNETKRSNDLTEQTLDHLRDAFQFEHRPWVLCSSVSAISISVDAPQKAFAIIHNFGGSPAVRCGGWACTAFDERFKEEWWIPDPAEEKSVFPLGAGDEKTLRARDIRQLYEPQKAAIVSERAFLYLFGIVTYFDLFDGSHETRFCHRFDPKSGAWAFTETGNEAS